MTLFSQQILLGSHMKCNNINNNNTGIYHIYRAGNNFFLNTDSVIEVCEVYIDSNHDNESVLTIITEVVNQNDFFD